MKNKNIQETLKRFRELITEETLYGGLVDKSLLSESATSNLKSAIKSLGEFKSKLKNMDFNFDALTTLTDDLKSLTSIDVSKIKNTSKSLEEINGKLDDIKKRVNELLTEESIKNLTDAEKQIQRELKLAINDGIDRTKNINKEIKNSIDGGITLLPDTQNFIKNNYGDDFLKKVETNISSRSKFLSSSLGKKLTLAKKMKTDLTYLVKKIPKEYRKSLGDVLTFVLNPRKGFKIYKFSNPTVTITKYWSMLWAYSMMINSFYCWKIYSWEDKYNLDSPIDDTTSDEELDYRLAYDFFGGIADAFDLALSIGGIIPGNPIKRIFKCEGEVVTSETLQNLKSAFGNEDIKVQMDAAEEAIKNRYQPEIDAANEAIKNASRQEKIDYLKNR